MWGAHKRLIVTLKAPTAAAGDFTLGTIALHVNRDRAATPATVKPQQLAYAVVEPAKKPEAVASIDTQVYRKSWLQNNLGRMRQQFYHWVKAGEKDKAQEVVDDYRRQLHDAEARSGLSLQSPALKKDMAQMETELNESFRGAPAEQSVKQNRFSKKMQYLGRKEQRQ